MVIIGSENFEIKGFENGEKFIVEVIVVKSKVRDIKVDYGDDYIGVIVVIFENFENFSDGWWGLVVLMFLKVN